VRLGVKAAGTQLYLMPWAEQAPNPAGRVALSEQFDRLLGRQ